MIRYPGTILPIVPGPGERVLLGWWGGGGYGNHVGIFNPIVTLLSENQIIINSQLRAYILEKLRYRVYTMRDNFISDL